MTSIRSKNLSFYHINLTYLANHKKQLYLCFYNFWYQKWLAKLICTLFWSLIILASYVCEKFSPERQVLLYLHVKYQISLFHLAKMVIFKSDSEKVRSTTFCSNITNNSWWKSMQFLYFVLQKLQKSKHNRFLQLTLIIRIKIQSSNEPRNKWNILWRHIDL